MKSLRLPLIAGLSYGLIVILLMIPLDLQEKRTAMTGAFFSRFAIGFLIPLVKAPFPPILTGGMVGLQISLPDAVITGQYAPILVVGVLGGIIIGWVREGGRSSVEKSLEPLFPRA